jgi:hypothetical protein
VQGSETRCPGGPKVRYRERITGSSQSRTVAARTLKRIPVRRTSDHGERRQPIKRRYAHDASTEELHRRHFLFCRRDHHDETADDEEQVDAGSAEVRYIELLCSPRNYVEGMHPYDHQGGHRTQVLNWTNHVVKCRLFIMISYCSQNSRCLGRNDHTLEQLLRENLRMTEVHLRGHGLPPCASGCARIEPRRQIAVEKYRQSIDFMAVVIRQKGAIRWRLSIDIGARSVLTTAPDREAALVPRHRQKNIPRVPRETTCAAAAFGPRPG